MRPYRDSDLGDLPAGECNVLPGAFDIGRLVVLAVRLEKRQGR